MPWRASTGDAAAMPKTMLRAPERIHEEHRLPIEAPACPLLEHYHPRRRPGGRHRLDRLHRLGRCSSWPGADLPVQLVLTYLAEAALPLFVLGLYAVQRPRIGRLGLLGALGSAYAYIYFTGTVTYSLVEHTPDWVTLTAGMGPWLIAHGAIMVAAGAASGWPWRAPGCSRAGPATA